jgi:phosphoglycerate dehydrogenase-like enzyme
MLALSRQLPIMLRQQEQGQLTRIDSALLKGKTVGILGVGAISAALAPLCKAFGMHVVGISSSPERSAPGFDRLVARTAFDEVLPQLDYLVILIPLADNSRHIVGATQLALLKPSAYVINLSRAGTMDDAALAEALRQGRIAGAALDVFEISPESPESPWHGIANIIFSSHVGGYHMGFPSDIFPILKANTEAFLREDYEAIRGLLR